MNNRDQRTPVELQQQTMTQNALGENVEQWETVVVVWASVKDLTGWAKGLGTLPMNETLTRYRFRHYPGIEPQGWRLVKDGRVVPITRVSNIKEESREVEIESREVRA